jgi:hypothetical protein
MAAPLPLKAPVTNTTLSMLIIVSLSVRGGPIRRCREDAAMLLSSEPVQS